MTPAQILRQIINNKYFLPGLKRWIVLLLLGVVLIVFGIALVLELRPLSVLSSLLWGIVRSIASSVPPQISGPVVLILGIGLISFALWFTIRTVAVATRYDDSGNVEHTQILDSLANSYRQGHGAKIVTIGGGTGLATLLRGLKHYSTNITGIVTVGDDGGSSGVLRQELKIIPPGDIRNCIVALSDEVEILTSVFQYRFQEGTLKGHSLGNLFLAALIAIFEGDIAQSTKAASRILRSRGRVLPSSQEALHLAAHLEDGTQILGESNIPQGQKIQTVFNTCPMPPPLKESLEAIEEAELIILGPGSLYTSIIPNLLFPEIVDAIIRSNAKVLYVCNLVEDKETVGYKVHDFVDAIHKHSGRKIIDSVLINAADSWDLYSGSERKPIHCDMDKLLGEDVEVITRPKLFNQNGHHNSVRLARSIILWFTQQNKQNTNNV